MPEPTSLDTLPEVLTTREAAALLRCSQTHFSNLLNGRIAGLQRIPSVRLGRRRLVRKVTLAEWLRQLESRLAALG